MKKSKIAIGIAAFLGLTLLLASNQCDTKLYEKQKRFTSSSEVLEQLNNKVLRDDNNFRRRKIGYNGESSDVLECFSQRKRLTDTDLHYDKIEIEQIIDLTESQQKIIVDNYEKRKLNYSKAKPTSKVEAVRLKFKPYYFEYSDDGEKIFIPCDKLNYMNLIFIDEGEGMVIDYIQEAEEQDSIEG
ncbi:MAG TPA: hypothetical protein DG753_12640, partial [Clostridium sp.]|nr:hypothetical protein [Clostridium sp.]